MLECCWCGGDVLERTTWLSGSRMLEAGRYFVQIKCVHAGVPGQASIMYLVDYGYGT